MIYHGFLRRHRILSPILCLVACLTIAPNAHAQNPPQWQLVASGEYKARTLVCNPHVLGPNITFVGGTLRIYRDREEPTRFVPVALTSGVIHDICFANKRVGWAAASDALLRTVNGGGDWTVIPLDTFSPNRERWTSIYYHDVDSLLIVTSIDSGMLLSRDGGNTFEYRTTRGLGGVAFISDSDGFICGQSRSPSLYTTDAGRTWSEGEFIPSWRPFVDESQRVIYVALDGRKVEDKNYVCASYDGGKTWDSLSICPADLTGQLLGDCKELFAPSDQDVLRSLDRGRSWDHVGGPPMTLHTATTLIDTTLYAWIDKGNGTHVYAGKLDIENARISIPESLRFVTACVPDIRDVFVRGYRGCDTPSVVTAKLTRSTAYTFERDPKIPWQSIDGTLGFRLRYTPANSYDTGHLELRIRMGRRKFDTSIVLYGVLDPTTGSMTTAGADLGRITLCEQSQGWVRFKNTDCVPTSVISLDLAGKTEFSVLQAPSVPLTLGPGQEDSVLVHFSPRDIGGRADVLQLKTKRGLTVRTYDLPVAAAATNSLATSLSRTHLDLGTISICDSTGGSFVLHNLGCDSFQIAESSLTGSPVFEFSPDVRSSWIRRGDSLVISLTAQPLSTGVHFATGELRIRSSRGATTATLFTIRVGFEGNRDPWTVSLAKIDETLPPCTTRDTVITISNPRTCDTLTITAISVTDGVHIGLTHEALPIRILPGDSMQIKVHLDPDVQALIVDALRITGSIDTTIPIRVEMQGTVAGSAEVLEATREYRTPLCRPMRGSVRFIAHGCRGLEVRQILLRGQPSRFRIASSHNLPQHLAENEALHIEVEYDPDVMGGDATELVVLDDKDNEIVRIPLVGSVTTTRDRFGVGLLGDPEYTLEPGQEFTMYLTTTTPLLDTWGLTEIKTGFAFDPKVVALQDAKGNFGWLASHTAVSSGAELTLSNPSTLPVPAGSAIATVKFRTRFSSTKESDLSLTPVILNQGDVDFARCIVAVASGASWASHITIPKNCGERLLDSLREKFYREIRVIAIERRTPNTLEIKLEAEIDAGAHVTLHDALGRVVAESVYEIRPGLSELVLDCPTLSQGSHFLRIRTEHSVLTYPLPL